MNKNIADKIQFMLSGIISRYNENKDYIIAVKFSFKSGTKEYKGNYNFEGEELVFNGVKEKINIQGLAAKVSSESLNYDSLQFILEERGKATILDADQKNVKIKQADKAQEETLGHESGSTSQILNRNYYVKIGEADSLLKEIGVLTKEGKIRNDMIRKYNQIDHFVELVDKMIDEMPEQDTITILDCGCGKSYLTFVLNYYIKEKKKRNCYFIGIDRSDKVIAASKEIAKRLNYKNMMFINEDINSYQPLRRIDMVISLHACDTATDMALGIAIRVKAKAIMCVPCCHKELLTQIDFDGLNPLLKQGVFRARFSDMVTDSVRSLLLEANGYKVSAVEYISPLETPKNILIRAIKIQEKSEKAMAEYYKIKKILNIKPSLEYFMYDTEEPQDF